MNSAIFLLEKEKNVLETQLSEIKVLLAKCEITSNLSLAHSGDPGWIVIWVCWIQNGAHFTYSTDQGNIAPAITIDGIFPCDWQVELTTVNSALQKQKEENKELLENLAALKHQQVWDQKSTESDAR